ncbi:DNA adenine methylase [Mammaliicoccus sciuri]|uniref:DNA adenine methylase n=1 Tax=Mammaliicoccus sciuri TaxID=1296 RepID=UPI002DB793B3|nr:DNA adenine methylase [Mammaliicoccus sciuri]MEB7465722.1 DNA adenine methylase [Mammaliicoccus sciuri]
MRYIGSKMNLLKNIEELLNEYSNGEEKTFFDIFAGSNVVSEYFKKDYQIISNDILYFSYIMAKTNIENNHIPTFKNLRNIGIADPIAYLNQFDFSKCDIGYYEENYTPSGAAKRMYFTTENGKKIDGIRTLIEKWLSEGLISHLEHNYLLTSLIQAIPYISNITGTYGAYLKNWDKRALKPLTLNKVDIIDNNKSNLSFNENANDLVKRIKSDIAYIDPPYNKRQYAPNYHVLENIASNKKPDLFGVTGLMDYSKLKSTYSMQKKAKESLEELISNINSKHIILSYNNEGIIGEEDLIEIMQNYAFNKKVEIKRIPYRKYKSKVPSKNENLYEILIYIRKFK